MKEFHNSMEAMLADAKKELKEHEERARYLRQFIQRWEGKTIDDLDANDHKKSEL